jgi:hypothetical protein
MTDFEGLLKLLADGNVGYKECLEREVRQWQFCAPPFNLCLL